MPERRRTAARPVPARLASFQASCDNSRDSASPGHARNHRGTYPGHKLDPPRPRNLFRGWRNRIVHQSSAVGIKRLRGDAYAALLRGTASAFGAQVAGTGLAFALQVYLARTLGTSHFGTYAYAIAWLSVLALFGQLGLDSATLRFVPEYAATGRFARLRRFLSLSQSWTISASLGLLVVATSATVAFRSTLGTVTAQSLVIAFLAIPILAQMQLASSRLRAFQRIGWSQFPRLVLLPALVLGGSWAYFVVLDGRPVPQAAVLIYLLFALLVMVVVSLLSARVLRERERDFSGSDVEATQPADQREWLSVGLSLLLASGFGVVMTYADTLMIGVFLDPRDVGIYAATTRLARLTALPLMAVNAIVAPMISRMYHAADHGDLAKLVRMSALLVIAIELPVIVGLVSFGDTALGLFGTDFTLGYSALLILLVGQAVNAAAGPVGFLMTMTGDHRRSVSILGTCALANVCLNAALIPRYGIVGAAVSTAGTTATWNVAMYVVVRKRLGFRPSIF